MSFWIIAAIVLFAGAVIALFPLLRVKTGWQPVALALAFALPAIGLWMYDSFGTPSGIDVIGTPTAMQSADPHSGQQAMDMESALAALQSRLEQNPDDLEGWVLLARTFMASQRIDEAAGALEKAHQLAPDNAFVMTDLAEVRIFQTTDGVIPQSSVDLLESALQVSPDMQKALWLMGIAKMQAGDDMFALRYWESLIEQLQPGSEVHTMVAAQIVEAQARLGMIPGEEASEPTTEQAPAEGDGWSGTRVVLDGVDGAKEALANGAVLFVTIRAPGPAMGPPLGVRRLVDPSFPLELTITDQDSMMAERPISSESEIQVQARVSLTGSPTTQPGDWRSAVKTTQLSSNGLVVLNIDQAVE